MNNLNFDINRMILNNDEEAQGPEIEEPIINNHLTPEQLADVGLYEDEPEPEERETKNYNVNSLKVNDIIECNYKNYNHKFIIKKINDKSFTCYGIERNEISVNDDYGPYHRRIETTYKNIIGTKNITILKNKRFTLIENFNLNKIRKSITLGSGFWND
jgi:hypothetical protein